MQTSTMTKNCLILFFIIGCGALLIYQVGWAKTDGPGKEILTNSSVVAFQTLDGKLIKIEGNFYIVEDITGKQHRLRLSDHATLLRGPKKPGDPVRVEVIDSRALTIQ